MLGGMIKFNRGLMKMPLHWRLWVGLLVLLNMVVPLFFFGRLEAQLILGAIVLAGMLMGLITHLAGFTRLLGLGHFVWFPLLYWLWIHLDAIPVEGAFGLWIRALMVLNGLSLVIDVTDVARYLAGQRQEVVEGL